MARFLGEGEMEKAEGGGASPRVVLERERTGVLGTEGGVAGG